ncbi:GH36-type glycosyl hydrolase domain-containing protein [Gimibacter soli]|uniref:NdvB protein n=1 Tax=Gimibacter soli TaxID=3024400 RepID=A0AAE9XSW6_9PROT|nr:hypothetical protein [Gimibacter soli]WCL53480.1 hypothetical protein PH603_13125 [Gimibacter soli]
MRAGSDAVVHRQGSDVVLTDPLAMPQAGSFLWNPEMMVQMTCRGYATAQYMQPEPTKYSKGPVLEATTFMQPEHPYYSHHSGRFFYVKDRQNGELFSAPYEPVRAAVDTFEFVAATDALKWSIVRQGIEIYIELRLPKAGIAELWSLRVKNVDDRPRCLSIYPAFTFGFLSWMNQGSTYDCELQALIANFVTPYQRVADYFKHQHFRDKSFLMAEIKPDAWCARLSAFEGEGGMHRPDGVMAEALGNEVADYELPFAAFQYDVTLNPGEKFDARFVFGPAKDQAELVFIRRKYFGDCQAFVRECQLGSEYVASGNGVIQIETEDQGFDHFVNHWMTRQVHYLGATNRLTTDPQTRNYLQDHMGMSYVAPQNMRQAIICALSQQKFSGEMPDGILLHPEASLKYINQVPHTDHCIWLPVCITAYLNETADYGILEEPVPYVDYDQPETVGRHITKAMRWIAQNCDGRGLCLIAEGDWCDPMNMVGYQGKGVSSWLTLAAAYAADQWADILECVGEQSVASDMRGLAEAYRQAANAHFWDRQWYARGITDDGVAFGVASDDEGSIYLNPQSWAMLARAADAQQLQKMLEAIETHLASPYGVAMLAPPYTKMREDVGRLTQKFPGTAENGSVYNHASAFLAFSLFEVGKPDRAFEVLRKMLPSETDCVARGQLPVYIPNYYRGAHRSLPRTSGRSSQLFNTGSVAWFARIVIERLFGLEGCAEGLRVNPSLPSHWKKAHVTRRFRGAIFNVTYSKRSGVAETHVYLNGEILQDRIVRNVVEGREYVLDVVIAQDGELV